MDQYEAIWQYQQVDMELERYEREMRGSQNRRELIKYRDFLLEQQSTLKKIESDVEIMADRMEALADEIHRLEGAVKDASAKLAAEKPDSLEKTQEQIAQLSKLLNTIPRYENELARLKKDSDIRDKQQRETRVRDAKARSEFDRIKVVYDEEYKKASVKLDELKKKVAQEGKNVDPGLLEKYNVIKKHSTPPITRIRDGRCGGCNMQLPAADMNKIRTGAPFVECENCGRIILVQ